MSFEDQIRAALEGAAAILRQHVEVNLRALSQEVLRATGEERERAVAEAVEAAAGDARREVEAQVAQFRETAQKHTDHLKHVAESQLSELRKALEEMRVQAQQQLDAARRTAQGEIEKARGEVDEARGEAEKAYGDAELARGDVEKARGEVEQARREAEKAYGDAELARGDVKKARGEVEKARGEVEQARGETEQARGDVEKAHGEVEKARGEVEKAHGEVEKARGEVEQARGEAEQARGEAEQARSDLEKTRGEVEKARGETEQARRETGIARADAEKARDEARAETVRAHAEFDRIERTASAEAEDVVIARLTADNAVSERRITEAIERANTDSHQSELSRAARLAEAIRTLDEARGLSEILERLAHCAGQEVDRAAVLIVKGERLAGWKLAGFGPSAPPARSIDLSAEDAGLAGAVLESGVAASRPADGSSQDGEPGLPPFARDAGMRHAMALPVRVGGEVVAVLYADAPRVDTPSSDARWPAVLEVLVRHASRALEALTVQQAAGLSLPRPVARGSHAAVPGPVEHTGTGDEDAARRYARLLLSEIRMYHEPVVDAGRRSRDLLSRLRGEIDRARRLYEARVPSTVPARAEYFDQELIRTLADGDRTLLGGAE